MNIREFHYRVPWRGNSIRPGAHASRRSGAGHLFERLAPFLEHPDPRRIDLRASGRDPLQTPWVRIYQQRCSINVYAVIDVSASMGFKGQHPKMQVLGEFLASLALSTHRTGDALGIIASSDHSVPDFFLPPTRQFGSSLAVANRLAAFKPRGENARGLLHAPRFLSRRRSLVFLVSDFHYPLSQLRQLMVPLSHHDVVPMTVWDAREQPTANGLARFRDLETGAEEMRWLRPALRQRLVTSLRERRGRLIEVLREFGREPLFFNAGFQADALTRYFHSGS